MAEQLRKVPVFQKQFALQDVIFRVFPIVRAMVSSGQIPDFSALETERFYPTAETLPPRIDRIEERFGIYGGVRPEFRTSTVHEISREEMSQKLGGAPLPEPPKPEKQGRKGLRDRFGLNRKNQEQVKPTQTTFTELNSDWVAFTILPGNSLYRVYGQSNEIVTRRVNSYLGELPDGSAPIGESWTTHDPAEVEGFRDKAGLPTLQAKPQDDRRGNVGKNYGRFVIEVEALRPLDVETRPALPLDGNVGGLTEVRMRELKDEMDSQERDWQDKVGRKATRDERQSKLFPAALERLEELGLIRIKSIDGISPEL